MNVTFDERTHTYECDGKPVQLCVSDVLEMAGISGYADGVPRFYVERAGQIGTAVHRACQFLEQGELDLETVDEQIAGYVLGYNKFLQAFEPDWAVIEEPMVDMELGLGGTPDRIGMMWEPNQLGAPGDLAVPVIVDIKTAVKPEAHWGLQLSAYAMLSGREDYSLYVLHLGRDGNYDLIPRKFERDVVLAAIQVASWRIQNGAKLKRR